MRHSRQEPGSALRAPRRVAGGLLTALSAFTLGFILLPLVLVTWMSFFSDEILVYPPSGYTLRWYPAAFQQKPFIDGFILSLEVATLATGVALLLGAPAAAAASRLPRRVQGGVLAFLTAPLIVPAIVIGTALYFMFIEVEVFSGIRLSGAFLGLVLAHALVALPWVVRLLTAALMGFDRRIEEAAISLGAHPVRAFLKVTYPSLRPALVASALFGFVTSFGNLEMTLFLIAPGSVTLPIATLQYLQWKLDPIIAAISVVQIAVIVGLMLVTDRFVRLSKVI
jgi:putative spermidine/putrescine transport system permease protein